MNDLGSSWYINSDVDSVEVFKITEDMITAKILKKYDLSHRVQLELKN